MKQQTAVQWLRELYDSRPAYEEFISEEEWEQALEMEKEQIINAYIAGESDGDHYEDSSLIYYIDTFKII